MYCKQNEDDDVGIYDNDKLKVKRTNQFKLNMLTERLLYFVFDCFVRSCCVAQFIVELFQERNERTRYK